MKYINTSSCVLHVLINLVVYGVVLEFVYYFMVRVI